MVWSDVLCHSLCICLSELLFITDYKSIIQRIQKTARCDCLVFLVGNAILYGLLLVKCVWKQEPDIITSSGKKKWSLDWTRH